MTLAGLTARDIGELVRKREITASFVVRQSLERIEHGNEVLQAFALVDHRGALEAAHEIDGAIRRGLDPGPLAGVPIGVKHRQAVRGLPTYRYSDSPSSGIATEDSPIVAGLRSAGCVVVGKTAIPDSASGEHTICRTKRGVTKNPLDLTRTAGGSSGGSAAAVASGMVPMATGGDSAGSVRIPASYCGVLGMKPTTQLLRGPSGPRIVDLTTSGLFAKSAEDVALAMDSLVRGIRYLGFDGAPQFEPQVRVGITEPLIAAWTPDFGHGWCSRSVSTVARNALDQAIGAGLLALADHQITIPDPGDTWWTLYDWNNYVAQSSPGEAPSSSAGLRMALRRREAIIYELTAAFEEVDVIVTPTTPTVAHPIAEGGRAFCPPAFTWGLNIGGMPAISIPAGRDETGMPVGIQLVMQRFDDHKMVALAARMMAQLRGRTESHQEWSETECVGGGIQRIR